MSSKLMLLRSSLRSFRQSCAYLATIDTVSCTSSGFSQPNQAAAKALNFASHRYLTHIRSFSNDASISDKIGNMVKRNKVVVFMKGIPEQPMCGFSNAVVQVLRMHGVENYDAHNVLEDDQLRQGIKDYSEWPTIPQVYFNGEFIGGCDIMLQLHQNGELIEELQKIGIESAIGKE